MLEGPITGGTHGWAFGRPVLDLATCGYVEEEFFLSGDATTYRPAVGSEFARDGQPDKETTKAVQKACLERDLLLLTCGTFDNVIRWIPPLVVNGDQIDEGLRLFAEALGSVH